MAFTPSSELATNAVDSSDLWNFGLFLGGREVGEDLPGAALRDAQASRTQSHGG